MDKSTHSLNNLKDSIEDFIDFLCEGLTTQSLKKDGVVLLCQSEEDISHLIRAVKQTSLEARFNFVIKGMGDLKSFVRNDYPKYLPYVEDLKFHFKKWSDIRAKDLSDLLNQLLGKDTQILVKL